MTLAERIAAFERAFPKWPASWPVMTMEQFRGKDVVEGTSWLVQEQARDVLYAIWLIGNDYRNQTHYYGSYPPKFLERVMALFPDALPRDTLHVFSGSLPKGPYVRLDINPALQPDVVGSVYDAATLFPRVPGFRLVVADPPYSQEDAMHYNTQMIDRRRTTAALAAITAPGGHLVWLDTVWPMHNKTQWLTVGRILVQRSTNHRARVVSIFERVA
jgi:hypothetical protein